MHHHHRYVAVTVLRHHVADVHLIDGDVAAGTEIAQFTRGLLDLLAADEELPCAFSTSGLSGVLTSERS